MTEFYGAGVEFFRNITTNKYGIRHTDENKLYTKVGTLEGKPLKCNQDSIHER